MLSKACTYKYVLSCRSDEEVIVTGYCHTNHCQCTHVCKLHRLSEQWQGVAESVSPTHISHCHLYWYHLFLIKTRHTTGLHVHTCTTCLHNSWPTDPASLIETICYLHHAQIMKKYSIPWWMWGACIHTYHHALICTICCRMSHRAAPPSLPSYFLPLFTYMYVCMYFSRFIYSYSRR